MKTDPHDFGGKELFPFWPPMKKVISITTICHWAVGNPKNPPLPFHIDEEMNLLQKLSPILLVEIPSGASYAFL